MNHHLDEQRLRAHRTAIINAPPGQRAIIRECLDGIDDRGSPIHEYTYAGPNEIPPLSARAQAWRRVRTLAGPVNTGVNLRGLTWATVEQHITVLSEPG